MQMLWENKYVRFGLFGVGVLLVAFIVLVFLASLGVTRSTGLGLSTNMVTPSYAPGVPSMGMSERAAMDGDDMEMAKMLDSYYEPAPVPSPSGGYTSGLETYETTQYAITGQTSDFDQLCGELVNLKARSDVHVKYLNESTNHCSATLYVENNAAADVLATLTVFDDIEYNRSTESVTRHKEQLESRTAVREQQLASVSRSLTMAETEFDELATYARNANDAAALSEAIRYKLQNIDTLTQRKISLTAQLDSLYQQAADLQERLGVVEFAVSVSRANPIYVGKFDRAWERAWQDLEDTATETLIGLTVFFGVFLLWVLRIGIYLLVLIVVVRFLWKFAQVVWRRW